MVFFVSYNGQIRGMWKFEISLQIHMTEFDHKSLYEEIASIVLKFFSVRLVEIMKET